MSLPKAPSFTDPFLTGQKKPIRAKHVNELRQVLEWLRYTLALDDFVLGHAGSPLLDLACIAKVDFLQTTPDQWEKVVADLVRRKITPLAEKVETEEEFIQAAVCGFTHSQGCFFSRPAS